MAAPWLMRGLAPQALLSPTLFEPPTAFVVSVTPMAKDLCGQSEQMAQTASIFLDVQEDRVARTGVKRTRSS